MGSRVYETVNVVGQHQDRGTSSAWYDRPSHTEWSQLGKMVQGEWATATRAPMLAGWHRPRC